MGDKAKIEKQDKAREALVALTAKLAQLCENGNNTASYWLERVIREPTVIGRAEVIARLEMDQRELLTHG